MKLRTALLTLMMVLLSCATQDICDDDNQSLLVARFKSASTGQVSDTVVSGLSIFGIREGKPDSLLYDSATLGSIGIPLDPNRPESVFVMSAGLKTDTLAVRHSSEVYLISYSCGFAALFTLEEIDHKGELIRDTEIINVSVDAETETDEEHIRIYF